jgi:acetyl-CoA acetyltransferase
MAAAPVPALEAALKDAGITLKDLKEIKTHNPFAVNDVNLGNMLGIDQKIINNFGCSLVYGHPQAPTAGRAIVELIEALAVKGGGYGAYTGCAAGDMGASIIVKVG